MAKKPRTKIKIGEHGSCFVCMVKTPDCKPRPLPAMKCDLCHDSEPHNIDEHVPGMQMTLCDFCFRRPLSSESIRIFKIWLAEEVTRRFFSGRLGDKS